MLAEEEEEEAVKAVAKKAKKLRQQLNPAAASQAQPAQQIRASRCSSKCGDVISGSGADPAPKPSTDASAAWRVTSQASAAKDQGPELAGTQSSALSVSGLATYIAAAAKAAHSLCSDDPSSSRQDSVYAGQAGGSPGAIHKLLGCPRIKVSPDCIVCRLITASQSSHGRLVYVYVLRLGKTQQRIIDNLSRSIQPISHEMCPKQLQDLMPWACVH